MIQVNRIYLIFNRLETKKFLVDTSVVANEVKNEQKSKERQGFLKKEKHIPRGHTSP